MSELGSLETFIAGQDLQKTRPFVTLTDRTVISRFLSDEFNGVAVRILGKYPAPANPRERLDMVFPLQRLVPRDDRILLFPGQAKSQMVK